jgi:hypothetical protein
VARSPVRSSRSARGGWLAGGRATDRGHRFRRAGRDDRGSGKGRLSPACGPQFRGRRGAAADHATSIHGLYDRGRRADQTLLVLGAAGSVRTGGGRAWQGQKGAHAVAAVSSGRRGRPRRATRAPTRRSSIRAAPSTRTGRRPWPSCSRQQWAPMERT